MPPGGQRENAGRPKGKTMLTTVKRIPVDITNEQIQNIPVLKDLVIHWECEAAKNPEAARYYFLRQLVSEIHDLGF